MAENVSISEIKPVEMLLGTALIWKLLTDELCAREPNALKSLTANLDSMVSLLRSGAFSGVDGVVTAMALFRTVLTGDGAVVSDLLKNPERFLADKVRRQN